MHDHRRRPDYRIERIIPCDFDNDALTCARCGYKGQTRTHYKACGIIYRPPGWGDKVELFLACRGLSKRRWHRWMVFLRLAKPDDGCMPCGWRQEQLNRIGDRFLRWWRSLFA